MSRWRARWPTASGRAPGTNVGVGITGIAGPGGGTPEKPVGTVAIAVVVDDDVRVRTFQFIGGREQVKFQASQAALNMLRLLVTGCGSSRATGLPCARGARTPR